MDKNSNYERNDRRKYSDRRKKANDTLYAEWVKRGLTQERRRSERRKKMAPEGGDVHLNSCQEPPDYNRLIRKPFYYRNARTLIIEAYTKNFHRHILSIGKVHKRNANPEINQLPFITISRQAGTGGHLLAEAIIREMGRRSDLPIFQGWQLLDQEICSSVMNNPRLTISLESVMTEKFDSDFDDFIRQIFFGTSSRLTVYHKIFEIIRTFAQLGKVIIVGRAGSLLTRDLDCGIHVRLVASEESRVHQIASRLQISSDAAKKLIDDKDDCRRRLVKTCFNLDIGDPLLYDAIFNADSVPTSIMVSTIIHMAQQKNSHRKGPCSNPEKSLNRTY